MKIKQFYLESYPNDDLGLELNSEATFSGLWEAIRSNNVYDYIGVGDSIIRERVFEKFSEITGHDYDYIYKQWLEAGDSVPTIAGIKFEMPTFNIR